MVMCGPIALALPLNRKNTATMLSGIGMNQLGRITTYATLGAILSIFGMNMHLFKGFQIASILTGIAFLLVIWKPNWLRKLEWQPAFLNRFRQRNMGKLLQRKNWFTLYLLGVLNGLLPCALLLVALGISLAQGSTVNGIAFMIAYGLGTVPGMIGVAFFGARMLQRIPVRLQQFAPVALSTLAFVLVLRGLNLGIPYLSPGISNTEGQEVAYHAKELPRQIICH